MSNATDLPDESESKIKASVDGKLRRRLQPLLFLSALLCYVDRTNISFAALQMKDDLSLSNSDYGMAAGVFFLPYSACAVPMTLLVKRVGVHRGLAAVVALWGLASGAMAAVHTARQLVLLRLLIGVAQAPFFPSVVYYLTQWYTPREMAVAYAAVRTATAVSGIIGGPLAAVILHTTNWRWLFALEAAPAAVLALVLLFCLEEGPAQARFLGANEIEWLGLRVRAARPSDKPFAPVCAGLATAACTREVWVLIVVWILYSCGYNGLIFWIPSLLKSLGMSDFAAGMLTLVPYGAAVCGMMLVARSSDRTGERRWHIAGSALFAAAAFFCAAGVVRFGGSAKAPLVVCLSAAAAGVWAMFGPFWAIPTALLTGDAAAAGFALINSVGVLGGFIGSWLMGAIREKTGSFDGPLTVFGALLTLSSLLSLCLSVSPKPDEISSADEKTYTAVPTSEPEMKA